MKQLAFLKLTSIAAIAALISMFFLIGCAEDPAANDGDTYYSSSGGTSSDGGSGTSSDGSGSGGTNSGINPTITIINNTGYNIGGIYIKISTTAQSWGSNLYGYSYLYDGDSREFTLSQPLSVNSVYDFRLSTSSNEYSFIKYGVTVSNGMTITFTTNDVNDGSSQPSIVLQNRSGKTFNSVHIKPSVISDWGESFGSVSNNSDLSANILIPPSNYTVFDIQTRSTNPTNTYTRNNVTISNGMTFIFTSADADNSTIELPVIVIQNNTGYNIDGIYIKSSTSTDWGSNLYGYSYLYDESSRTFSLSQHLSANSVYDIRLRSSSGNFTFTKYNFTVSEGMIVTFTTSDLEE